MATDPMNDPELADLLNTPVTPPAKATVPIPKTPAVAATVAAPTEVAQAVHEAVEDKDSTMPPPPLDAQDSIVVPRPANTLPPAIPLPESDLTPEQREIRALRHQLAVSQATTLEKVDYPEVVAEGENKILIHFLTDRFTWAGKTWYRGQELEFDIPGAPYEGTKDRNGKSWLTLTEMEQVYAYGDVMWRHGPWPGEGYAEPEVDAAERRRRRAAPIMPRL